MHNPAKLEVLTNEHLNPSIGCTAVNADLFEELRTLISRHAGTDYRPTGQMQNVMLAESRAEVDPCPYVVEPVFSVIVQGSKRLDVAEQSISYGVGQYLVVAVDMPVDAFVVEASKAVPFLGFGLTLRSEAIANLLLDVGTLRSTLDERVAMAVGDLQDDLLEPIVRLVRLFDRLSDIPILAPAIEREILWRLLNGPNGNLVRQIGLADSRLSQVGRAIRWLRSHFAERISVNRLAEVAGMSVTSLHRHFRLITSLTPIQYQKQLRLHAARARIMTAKEDVAEVGYAVGYDSPSQFSREYRRLFGNPPGRDGARLRSTAP